MARIVVQRDRGVVLVVDDDEDYRTIVRRILERERYFVLEARDGYDALDLLRSEAGPAIRLIILDLVMPAMSGWDVVQELRRDPALSRVPVLVTSAMPVHGDASGIGATIPSLGKPVDEERLLSAVAGVMGGRYSAARMRFAASSSSSSRSAAYDARKNERERPSKA
ncbi:MAG TPA: response regulator [Polyangiaceae bacterium]|nr:response regulator [Polyangiaceae bacterium]